MSWMDDICKKHEGFVHTGPNCIMCVDDALRANPRVNDLLIALRHIRDKAKSLEAAQEKATIAIERYVGR